MPGVLRIESHRLSWDGVPGTAASLRRSGDGEAGGGGDETAATSLGLRQGKASEPTGGVGTPELG